MDMWTTLRAFLKFECEARPISVTVTLAILTPSVRETVPLGVEEEKERMLTELDATNSKLFVVQLRVILSLMSPQKIISPSTFVTVSATSDGTSPKEEE